MQAATAQQQAAAWQQEPARAVCAAACAARQGLKLLPHGPRVSLPSPLLPPAIGFNVETVAYKNIKFQVWDLGGQTSIRPYWRCYYPNTQVRRAKHTLALCWLFAAACYCAVQDCRFLAAQQQQQQQTRAIPRPLVGHHLCC